MHKIETIQDFKSYIELALKKIKGSSHYNIQKEEELMSTMNEVESLIISFKIDDLRLNELERIRNIYKEDSNHRFKSKTQIKEAFTKLNLQLEMFLERLLSKLP